MSLVWGGGAGLGDMGAKVKMEAFHGISNRNLNKVVVVVYFIYLPKITLHCLYIVWYVDEKLN